MELGFAIGMVVGFIGLGLPIWAFVDLLTRPDAWWEATGQSRLAWGLILVGATMFTPFGWIAAIVYLAPVPRSVYRRAAELTSA